MRLGVVITQIRPWRLLAEDFRAMEELGYDVAYVYDHLTHPTVPGQWLGEAFSTLAAAASTTSRMELGTLVASAQLHSPVSLARRAATVQDVCGGRLVLGVGAGAPFCAMADRGETIGIRDLSGRFADVVTGYRAVMRGATEWEGSTRSFAGLQTLPLPAGTEAPFLLVAAHGPKALAVAAEHGDGWNTYGGPYAVQKPEGEFWTTVGEQAERLTDELVRRGREPGSVRRSLLLGFGTVNPTASEAAYEDAIGRASEAGFDELVVYGPFGTRDDQFWSDPAIHSAVLARHRVS